MELERKIREAFGEARERVAREWPGAQSFKPEWAEDGRTLIGFTFLFSRRYGWVTLAGTYARGLEPYRSVAAELLPIAVEQEERDAARGRS